MPKLQWDQAGSRLYEVGVDRGVLYLEDDSGVPWNGVTSVEEDFAGDDSTPVYFDGVKINDSLKIGDFAATLSAITYPDEFLPYEGVVDLGGGMYADGQNSKTFGLSFRTLVGNDLEFSDLGYKVHILYNLTAVPGSLTRETLTDTPNPAEFTWSITSVPVKLPGYPYRPTAHVIFDSRFIPDDIMAAVESILYGGSGGSISGSGSSSVAIYDGGRALDVVGDPLEGGSAGSDGEDLPEGPIVYDAWAVVYDGGHAPPDQDTDLDGGGAGSHGEELPDTGTMSTEPRLPSIPELIELVTLWSPKLISPNTGTGIADLVNGSGDLTQSAINGVYVLLPGSRLVPSITDGVYTLAL